MPFQILPSSSFGVGTELNPAPAQMPVKNSIAIEHPGAGDGEMEIEVYPMTNPPIPLEAGFGMEVLIRMIRDAQGLPVPGSINPWKVYASDLPNIVTLTSPPPNSYTMTKYFYISFKSNDLLMGCTYNMKISLHDSNGMNIGTTKEKTLYFSK
jgi:hypothetical protein